MRTKARSKYEVPREVIPNAIPERVITPTPRSQWLTITPEVALMWLNDHNSNNRAIRANHIRNLAADMKAGNWRGLNGEAIRFDTSNRLVDGQHRLWACIEAKTPFQSLVIWDVSPEDYSTIGIGKAKNYADFLGPIHGEKNCLNLAAVLSLVYSWEKGQLEQHRSNRPSIQQLNEVRERHPELPMSVNYCCNKTALKKVMNVSMASLLYYAASREGFQHKAETFLEKIATGLNLTITDPAFHFRNFAMGQRSRKGKFEKTASSTHELALFIKAWNLFKADKPCQLLALRKDEKFPTL